ncbi:Protein of unknown function [Pyronema omphalodes CBS 100304]|uniref:Secreted protein n=1 Tax=Pyronema omphalodes (strain CBS 100304) TaxID=1076935 RepID=U4LS40_PYROM|nr:Protein of unknown function [Pyronema omphalodes CBS 100304]
MIPLLHLLVLGLHIIDHPSTCTSSMQRRIHYRSYVVRVSPGRGPHRIFTLWNYRWVDGITYIQRCMLNPGNMDDSGTLQGTFRLSYGRIKNQTAALVGRKD